MIYRGRMVVPMKGEVIRDGAVVVRNGIIREVGEFDHIKRTRAEEIRDLRPLIFLPGLVNCHTHLEEGLLRAEIETQPTFTSFSARVAKYLKDSDIVRRIHAVRLGCRESLFHGTTTLADTASCGTSYLVLREEDLRTFVFLHFRGPVPWEAQSIFHEIEFRLKLLDGIFPLARTGLSPHAPYSTSTELYRLAIQRAKKDCLFLQTHLAESNEELEMFTSHSGPLFEHMQNQHAMDLRDYTQGPISFMLKNNLLPSRSIVIHGNYLSSDEFEYLSRRKVTLVHCAQNHEIFHHKDFPFETAMARGVNICLGTESLASSPTLSLFDEMNCIKRRHGDLDSQTILEFATVNAAKALGMENRIGALAADHEADIVGIQLPSQLGENLYDEILLNDPQVEFVMIKGEELIS